MGRRGVLERRRRARWWGGGGIGGEENVRRGEDGEEIVGRRRRWWGGGGYWRGGNSGEEEEKFQQQKYPGHRHTELPVVYTLRSPQHFQNLPFGVHMTLGNSNTIAYDNKAAKIHKVSTRQPTYSLQVCK